MELGREYQSQALMALQEAAEASLVHLSAATNSKDPQDVLSVLRE